MPDTNDKTPAAPGFSSVIELVLQKSPTQKKRLNKFLDAHGDEYWKLADEFMVPFTKYLDHEGLSLDYVVDSYLTMCEEMLNEQVKFLRSGEYSCKSIDQAVREVYGDAAKMKAYMHGLMASLFLWENHYLILRFFIDEVLEKIQYETCMEIGSGHGLFMARAVESNPGAEYHVVDISEGSLDMVKKVVRHFVSGDADIHYLLQNITKHDFNSQYDFIIMGEILEHVENPLELLTSIKKLLSDNGKCFITTCANCPAIDHIFLFKCVEEISEMISAAGFRIEKSLELPLADIPREKWKKRKTGINYAALISHA